MHRVLVVVLLAGCVPTSYAYTPASSRTFERKAEGCTFEMLTSEPQTTDFEEIGVLVHYNGDVPANPDKLKSIVGKQVCGVGGDAAVAVSDGNGYTKVRVLHFIKRLQP